MVSGYAVKSQTEYQKVYADQAHAWAEVYFAGLGWVEFDATGGGGGSIPEEPEEEEPTPPEIESIISAEGGKPPHVLVFEVYGATGSHYLRSRVGEEYNEESWKLSPDYQVVDYY